MRKILLSIKPRYVQEILVGSKQVEYRKQIPKDEGVRQVLIYASHPVKKVVAEFTVGGYITDTPERLWSLTHEIGGITKESFDDYFDGKDVGYAYRIENLRRFEEARKLWEFGMERGPQDYCYVEDSEENVTAG